MSGAAVIQAIADEVRFPLESLPPAVAVCRPVNHEELAHHFDAFAPDAVEPHFKARVLVRGHLIRFEGLELDGKDGRAPYDHANALHWLSLPAPVVDEIYEALLGEVR